MQSPRCNASCHLLIFYCYCGRDLNLFVPPCVERRVAVAPRGKRSVPAVLEVLPGEDAQGALTTMRLYRAGMNFANTVMGACAG